MGDRCAGSDLVRGGNVRGAAALSDNAALDARNKRLALKLLWLVAAAILFAYALVPLYDVMCRLSGLNGKTVGLPETVRQSLKVDESRWVKVEFTANVMSGLGWNFSPTQSSMRVHPGQIEVATYQAKNITNQVVVGQAIPSVSPGQAALYFKKIECFCFQRQSLNPVESKVMPLRFYVSPELPGDVKVITLSYAFYNAVNQAAK
ncbi:MAG: cytochrome c oxidase assembly protein [Nitrosomonadales bacterium]|nr:MAG: cytochrome c oxidase assembly protein [Nitrosomonadales bacterium]